MIDKAAAVVLSAGRSSRMGKFKPLISIAGVPMIRRVMDAVEESGVMHRVLVVGYNSEDILSAVPLEGWKVVENPLYAEGMASSIKAGFNAVPRSAVAVAIVLGDQPLIKSSTITDLVEHHLRARPDATAPLYHGRRGNPVVLDRRMEGYVNGLTGDEGAKAIFSKGGYRVEYVEVDDPGVVIDFDTPGDLKGASELHG